MFRSSIHLILATCALALACQGTNEQPAAQAVAEPVKQPAKAAIPLTEKAAGTQTTIKPVTAGKTESFGAKFSEAPTIALAALLANPGSFADKTVTTEGTIEKACSRKGCWMEIADGDSKCRVTFKNYGFFVPKDSAGATTRLQGTVTMRTVSAGRVKHLEAEGAHFPNKKPDGTAEEARLIATAVQLTR